MPTSISYCVCTEVYSFRRKERKPKTYWLYTFLSSSKMSRSILGMSLPDILNIDFALWISIHFAALVFGFWSPQMTDYAIFEFLTKKKKKRRKERKKEMNFWINAEETKWMGHMFHRVLCTGCCSWQLVNFRFMTKITYWRKKSFQGEWRLNSAPCNTAFKKQNQRIFSIVQCRIYVSLYIWKKEIEKEYERVFQWDC